MDLARLVLAGDRLALSRSLTQVENDTAVGRQVLNQLFSHTGQAHLIGITGAPGTGKSSLVNQIARHYRQNSSNKEDGHRKPSRVAIIAVDPTSPFSGGAILGDRVRMRDLAGDPGVFIRSMATRGSLGGLARTTAGLVQVMDAAGYDLIIIETVGAGQAEVDIAQLAHTTLVIEAPGLGDDIQAIKAGILEIADILVINKVDRPGSESTERALRSMLQLAHPVPHIFSHHGQIELIQTHLPQKKDSAAWISPIVKTIATEGVGIEELARVIDRHYAHLQNTGEWQQREQARLQAEVNMLLQETLVERWRSSISDQRYAETLYAVMNRQYSPWQAVETLLAGVQI